MRLSRAVYIIGGGPLGLNVIRWAKEAAFVAIVTDMNADAPGFELADESSVLDGTDTEGHLRFAKAMARKYDIAGVYCGSEFGLWTIYELSRMLGLVHNSHRSIANVLDKAVMKGIWMDLGIPTPLASVVKDSSDIRGFMAENVDAGNFIIKPAGGSGSRGVMAVNKQTDIGAAYEACRGSVEGGGEVLIEPYVEGRSIDANGVFIDGAFYRAGLLEKFSTPFPYFLPIGGYDPADIPPGEADEVYALLDRACRALGITVGPVKGDFLRGPDGYVVLEVAPRYHGDIGTSVTLPLGSKINPVKFYFNYLSTGKVDVSLISSKSARYATWRVICLPPGEVLKMPGEDAPHGDGRIMKVWHNLRCDRRIERYVDTVKIPGFITACGESKAEAEEALESYFDIAGYRVEPNGKDAGWYEELGLRLEEVGFSPKSCGFVSIGD